MGKDSADTDIRSFRRGLRELEREVGLAISDQTECCGVTPAQCHLLLAVEESGETSAAELSVELELDSSTLSRAVDGLVKAGYLLREEDPENRRRQIVSLSAAGKAKVRSINAICDRYYEGLLGSLPAKDSKAVVEALPLFVKAMREWRRSQSAGGCCAQDEGGSR
jgi:DNA-binding MarR family transcriptional regulator